MSVTLDGHILFDEQQLEIKTDSFSRDSIETAVPGLNGLLCVDLGRRTRMIKQRGVLRAKSRSQINNRISIISAYMDGNTHTLITSDGNEFGNLRMDYFKVSNERTDGVGIVVDYEIIYTQLV